MSTTELQVAGQNKIYTAYGISLASPLSLPLPGSTCDSAQVTVRFGPVCDAGMLPIYPGYRRAAAPGDVRLEWRNAGRVRVCGGRTIEMQPACAERPETLVPYLTGAALATVLHQRGMLVLHGCVLALSTNPPQAVAVLGPSGAGKSTLALAWRRSGRALLSDDLAVVGVRGSTLTVYPGGPEVRLAPDSPLVAGLGSGTPIHQEPWKRSYVVPSGHSREPAALSAVFVLETGPGPAVIPLTGADAVAELIRNSYCARLLGDADAPQHLARCAAVARTARVNCLMVPRSHGDLPRAVETLEAAANGRLTVTVEPGT